MVRLSFEAGHAIYTPGKRSPSGILEEREWFFNDKILKYTLAYLKKYDVQTKRFDDTTGKRDIPLKERVQKINAWGSDLHLSFHNNAYQSKWGNHGGTEVFTSNNASVTSETIAKKLQPAIVKALKTRDRGTKKANFYIITYTKMPAALIEFLFMDSKDDIKKLRSNAYLKKAGEAVAKTLVKHFKLKKKKKTSNNKDKVVNTDKDKGKYSLTANKDGHLTAADAKKGTRKKTTVKKGKYFVYKKSGGMLNLSKKKGVPGAWVNPGLTTSTKKEEKKTFKVKQKVKIKSSAKKYSRASANIPTRYKNKNYTVMQVGKSDVLIKELYSWVKKTDLK